jgi:hypothetical protein
LSPNTTQVVTNDGSDEDEKKYVNDLKSLNLNRNLWRETYKLCKSKLHRLTSKFRVSIEYKTDVLDLKRRLQDTDEDCVLLRESIRMRDS